MENGVWMTPVAVYWNVESCPIPKNIDPSSIQERIEATLKQYGYCGPLTIRAYGKLKYSTKKALRIAGIDVIDFDQAKDTAEKYMLVDISFLASDRCPAIYMLISEDLGFSHLVDTIEQRGYSFFLCHPNPQVSELLGAAKRVWGWPQLLLGEKPLPVDKACTSLANDNSISNLSSHPNSCCNQDTCAFILTALVFLFAAIRKLLGLPSRIKDPYSPLSMVLLTIILDNSEAIKVFVRGQSVHGGAGLFKIVGGTHSWSTFQDFSILLLVALVEDITKDLGLLVLPAILRWTLFMLLLLESVKCFLRFAGPFIPVIWDFENCPLPRRDRKIRADLENHYRYSIPRKIRAHLEKHGLFGPVIIRAYGNEKSLASGDLSALKEEIDVIHVNPGTDAADKRIMVDLPFFVRANMSAGTFMLISGDSDFVRLVKLLVLSGLKFLYCKPKNGAKAFDSEATMVCNWSEIVAKKPSEPLLMNAASATLQSDNSVSIPNREQTVVLDKRSDEDAMLIILMTVMVLLVGASKRLRLIACLGDWDMTLVLGMWTFMLENLGVINVFRSLVMATGRIRCGFAISVACPPRLIG